VRLLLQQKAQYNKQNIWAVNLVAHLYHSRGTHIENIGLLQQNPSELQRIEYITRHITCWGGGGEGKGTSSRKLNLYAGQISF
jgi:hypothetical protein